MKPSLKKSVLLALVLLQCTSIVYAQVASGGNSVISGQQQPESPQPTTDATPPTTTVPPPASTTVDPPKETTTEQPKPTSDQTPATTTIKDNVSSQTLNPTIAPSPDTPSATSNNTPASTTESKKPGKTTGDRNTAGNPSGTASGTAPSSSDTTSTTEPPPSPTNKTAIIAGSVVGGLVGIALIAGLLTWCNRRGGCTSRTRRRDAQADFDAGHDDYDIKMTDNHGASAGVAGAMHSSDNLPPPSPFQHARRFVPPTSNPTGYMNLNDEEYGYHQNANMAAYQPQQGGYQDYNNAAATGYHDGSHPDYSQDYQHDYYNQQQQQQQDYAPHHEYASHDYADNSVNGSSVGYPQAGGVYYNGSNVTSPTLTNAPNVAAADYRQQLKPDQIEQKPNAA